MTPALCWEERGSPPPMRGKVYDWDIKTLADGITPAYAGKRDCTSHITSRRRDHPRLCGEKLVYAAFLFLRFGSPPPMRGKVPTDFAAQLFDRITPAYAGKSPRGTPRQQISRDHPRLCGEKNRLSKPFGRATGSPPPMRGKAGNSGGWQIKWGITPAYAGKSHFFSFRGVFG